MSKTGAIGLAFGIVCLCGLQALAMDNSKYPSAFGFEPDQSIVYFQPEAGEALKLDVFFPDKHTSSSQSGCIVFFFGGGWVSGSTGQFYGYAKYLASRGLVAISAQYRTQSSHGATPRQSVEDGKEAMRYIRQHAKELGVDPNKIVAGGGSAGGHVAAACAMCPKIDANPGSSQPCTPNALVLLNPVYDNGPGGYGNDRVADCWKEISPFHNIRKGLPPTIVCFGSKDEYVPVATAMEFQKLMVGAGNDCETNIFDGQGHGFFNIGKGGRSMFEQVLVKIDAFLVKHGFLSGKNTVTEWTSRAIENLPKHRISNDSAL